jgi:hypothetical protein
MSVDKRKCDGASEEHKFRAKCTKRNKLEKALFERRSVTVSNTTSLTQF